MTHKIQVAVSQPTPASRMPVLEFETRHIGRWLFRRIFGAKQKLVILFPGDSIEEVHIVEQPPKGNAPTSGHTA